jgi:GT2 family glycosyltransferase
MNYNLSNAMKAICYVVIPNWNGIDLIEECLEGLRGQTLKHSVIVVDNGSVDGSNDVVRMKFPEVQLLEFPDNAGFAGGVNRGIRPALEQGAEYIALLNNDAVADKHWLEHLVARMEAAPEVGGVAAKIVTQDGERIDSTGDFYSTWAFPFPRGRGELDRGQYDAPGKRSVFAVSGGASLYRAKMFENIGVFDERFFAYYEDTDIGFRGQLAGWSMVYEPKSVVRHYIGGTSSRIDAYAKDEAARKPVAQTDQAHTPSPFARYHSVKNFSYLYTKNMPGWLYWKYLPRFWASWGMMVVSDLKRGLIGANIRANWAVLMHLPGILRDRYSIQRSRKVTPAYIDAKLYHALPPLQRLRFRRLAGRRGSIQ